MTATALETRVPRRVVPHLVQNETIPEVAPASSASLADELDALDRGREAAERRLSEQLQQRPAIVRDGSDEQADELEVDIRGQQRAIERADLRRPDLVRALQAAQQREDAERRDKQQAEAQAIVQAATSGEALAEYEAAALAIVGFVRRWDEATQASKAAGIPGPDDRLRTKPGWREPDRVESYSIWRGPDGIERDAPPRPSILTEDPRTGKMINPDQNEANRIASFRREERTRVVPGIRYPERREGSLASAIRLPGLGIGDEPFWPAPGR